MGESSFETTRGAVSVNLNCDVYFAFLVLALKCWPQLLFLDPLPLYLGMRHFRRAFGFLRLLVIWMCVAFGIGSS